jgi:hypothetical protein
MLLTMQHSHDSDHCHTNHRQANPPQTPPHPPTLLCAACSVPCELYKGMLTGQPPAVARYFGTAVFSLVNLIFLVSSCSVLDSTFASTSKVCVGGGGGHGRGGGSGGPLEGESGGQEELSEGPGGKRGKGL